MPALLSGTTRPHWRRRKASLLAASLLATAISIPALSTPAQAQTCEFRWGIRESYRSYIQGPVARGGWGADGIGFSGSETGPDGTFVFTPASAPNVQDGAFSVNLGGVLRFRGHNYGGDDLLDMTLSDFKIRASGNQAEILVDYVSYESDMVNKTARGPQITGDDVAIATINLNTPVDAQAGSVDLSGTTTLTGGGAKLFLAYNAGAAMDPTSGQISTSCGATSSGTTSGNTRTLTSISGNFTGFNKEAMAILSETNDTMNAFTKFMGNSEAFMDAYESFTRRTGAGNGSGSGAGAGNIADAPSTAASNGTAGGTVTGTGTGAASGSAASAGNAPGTASNLGTGGVSGQCIPATGVQRTNASWGIKASFQSYITGSIAKGKWELQGVGHSGGAFQFSGNTGNVDVASKKGNLRYSGAVHFTGHNGVLDLRISDLEVSFAGSQGQLIANVTSSNMEGVRTDFGRVAIANLNVNTLDINTGSLSGSASTALTAEGAKAFADFYQPGLALDPVTFTATLGAEGTGSCDAATSTGAQGGAAGIGDATGDATGANADSSTGYTDGSNNFRVKSAAAQASTDPATYLALLAIGLAVAAGSMSRLILQHPA
ncbi:HtaA domain-containing protein [Corynebacterium kozikiae]|uniref:HtaA domain-containing protein n=1 Tax=Corynebacterium kozikiae TaxID=2968469 RepID=UPI00211CA3B7|nr:HtaA domain-containing protein [Corynebacterium sp. 76QC2CO]